MRLIVLLTTLCFLYTPHARADFTSRESVDFGVTNNANLTKDAPVSDSYLRVGTSNRWLTGEHDLGFRMSYADYFKETQDDLLSLKLSDSYATGTPWKINAALVSHVYTQSNPGTTDTAFTNVGADLTVSRLLDVLREAQLTFEGGYRFRYYTTFDGRNDHTLFASLDFEKDLSRYWSIGSTGEVGVLTSSLSDYSRIYAEFTASAIYRITEKWEASGEISLGENGYTSRTVSAVTLVDLRRGARVLQGKAFEEYTLFVLTTDLMRKETNSLRWGFELNAMNQASRSGSLDFSSVDFLARAIWSF